MKRNQLANFIVAFIFMNATVIFSQNHKEFNTQLKVVDGYIDQGQFNKAHALLDSLNAILTHAKDSLSKVIELKTVKVLNTEGKSDEALQLLMKGFSSLKDNPKANFYSEYAYEIGAEFTNIDDFKNAFKYFSLAEKGAEIRKDSLAYSRSYLGLGSTYLRKYGASRNSESSPDSISIDSASYFYDKGILMFPKSASDKYILGTILTNQLTLNYFKENYDLAEDYGEQSLNLWTKEKDSLQMVLALNSLAAVNIAKQGYDKSLYYYNLGLGLVENRKDLQSLDDKRMFLTNLSYVYSRIGDFEKAYNFRKQSADLKDSIVEVTKVKELAEIEARFNIAEQEKIATQEMFKRKRAETWLVVVGLISLILMVTIWLSYRVRKVRNEKKRLILEQEKLLQERKLENLQAEAQIKILNATIDGKETERKHIAEILHNSVSTLLSSARLHLHAAKVGLSDPIPKEIDKSQDLVLEAGEKIRDLSHKLISSVLLKFGLSYAMEELCEKYSNSNLKFEHSSQNIERYNEEFEIKIYNIIEEFLNNIIKHSNASEASILLKQKNGKLEVHIFDDGEGFDVSKIKESQVSGLGLPQIEARIKMMKGTLDIKSSKETGTRIYFRVPVDDIKI